MENQALEFNLLSVLKNAIKWKKHIFIFVALVGIITAIFMFLEKNQYKSYGVFFPANTLISSRANMLRTEMQIDADAVGIENETDRVLTIGNSTEVLSQLIKKFNLSEHYHIDTLHDSKGKEKTFKKFAKNYSVNKGSNNEMSISVTDEDPQMAAYIANEALLAMQDKYRFIFTNTAEGIAQALDKQMLKQDSTIKKYSDSLINLRNKYGIYNLIAPSRKANEIQIQNNGKPNFAEGLELIQNVEEIKDKYVIDRAKYESVANEFRSTESKSIPFIHVITYPSPSGQKAGPFRILTILSACIIAFFIAVFLTLVVEYFSFYKKELSKSV